MCEENVKVRRNSKLRQQKYRGSNEKQVEEKAECCRDRAII